MSKPAVSFIGLGAMGLGMAVTLVKEGYPVTGFDLWGPSLERFKAAGGQTSTSLSEAVKGKDFCVCMVATMQQAQSVLIDGQDPAVHAMPKGTTLLLCSTVPCGYVQSLAKQLVDMGRDDIHLVDCPVSGGAGRAASGTLSIMAGASDAAIAKGRPLLQAMSSPTGLYIVKGGVGAGSNMKMVHQVLAANQILSASEALGFASHLGLDLKKTADAIIASEGWSWMFENRLPRMLAPDFQPVASALTIILKDTSIITSEARRAGFPTPMTSTAEQAYFAALGKGYGPDDDSSLIRLYTEGKGKVGPVAGAVQDEAAKTQLVIDMLRGIHLCAAAESIAFAAAVGLEFDQVFDLCIHAAGGSRMLENAGPEMIKAFREGKAASGFAAAAAGSTLSSVLAKTEAAVSEAQLLKTPVFLGTQALALLRLAQQSGLSKMSDASAASVIKLWA